MCVTAQAGEGLGSGSFLLALHRRLKAFKNCTVSTTTTLSSQVVLTSPPPTSLVTFTKGHMPKARSRLTSRKSWQDLSHLRPAKGRMICAVPNTPTRELPPRRCYA